MADDNVVALGGVTQSDQKHAWLDQVALAYDVFVRDYGREPEALFLVAIGGGAYKTSWDIRGDYKRPGFANAVILLAAETLRQSVALNEG